MTELTVSTELTELDAVLLAKGSRTYGVELSAVRNVVRCGPITPVPSAPPSIVGAVNAGGQVMAVVDLGVLLGEGPTQPRFGDAGLCVAVEDVEAVVVLGRVLEVAALSPREPPAEDREDAGILRPMTSGSNTVHLLDLSAALEEVRRQVAASVLELSAGTPAPEEVQQ
jgi:purine-binding chemotaxis protein CheW